MIEQYENISEAKIGWLRARHGIENPVDEEGFIFFKWQWRGKGSPRAEALRSGFKQPIFKFKIPHRREWWSVETYKMYLEDMEEVWVKEGLKQ